MPVGMGCEQAADLGVQGGDLGVERADHRHQRESDLPEGLALAAGEPGCRSGQPVIQDPASTPPVYPSELSQLACRLGDSQAALAAVGKRWKNARLIAL